MSGAAPAVPLGCVPIPVTARAPPFRPPLAVTSKVLMVTVRPPTKPVEPLVLVELSHIINVSVPLLSHHHVTVSPLSPMWTSPFTPGHREQGKGQQLPAGGHKYLALCPRWGCASTGGAGQVPSISP